MCMEDRWTVSPAIISYLPQRHLFKGQQIKLLCSNRQEKCCDRPAASACVLCQELLYSDERPQPNFANEHFGKANRCIQHQHFLITIVSCGIFCWQKRAKQSIRQEREKERDSGKQESKPQRMDFIIRDRFSPLWKCPSVCLCVCTCLETVKGVTATLNIGSVCQAAKKKYIVTFSSL